MTARQGPALTIAGTCEGCRWLTPTTIGGKRSSFARCAHPICAKSGVIFGHDAPTPAWCPRLADARAALGREMVAAAEQVLCSKCGKPVTTADKKSYRMHSMAGCPR